jgi:transcriptional regulator with XRE-family HTH domain
VKVTERPTGRTVPDVAKAKWPHREFRDYVEQAMKARGIPTPAELAREADITDALLSKWLNGKNQPSRGSLRKLATALGVDLGMLEVKAGLADEGELAVEPRPILPIAFEHALDAYNKATLDRPDLVEDLLRQIQFAAEWYEGMARKPREK